MISLSNSAGRADTTSICVATIRTFVCCLKPARKNETEKSIHKYSSNQNFCRISNGFLKLQPPLFLVTKKDNEHRPGTIEAWITALVFGLAEQQ